MPFEFSRGTLDQGKRDFELPESAVITHTVAYSWEVEVNSDTYFCFHSIPIRFKIIAEIRVLPIFRREKQINLFAWL